MVTIPQYSVSLKKEVITMAKAALPAELYIDNPEYAHTYEMAKRFQYLYTNGDSSDPFGLFYNSEYLNVDGNLPEKTMQVPLQALQLPTIITLAKLIDGNIESRNSEGTIQNWIGLAECMDLSSENIDYIEKYRESKTWYVLDLWDRRKTHTIGELWNFLHKLEREDIIMDQSLYGRTVGDGNAYIRKLEQDQKHQAGRCKMLPAWFPHRRRHQDKTQDDSPDLWIDPEQAMKLRRSVQPQEHEVIVVQDVGLREGEEMVIFDAYVSFCDKNMTFARELIRFLENDHGLKLCINERDLLAGVSKYDAIAEIIAKRCKKMIMVLSEDYLRKEECDFQSRLALSLNRSSIIIIYEKCEVPKPLKPFSVLRHYDLPSAWFWNRLKGAVQDEKTSIFQTTKSKKASAARPKASSQKIPKPLAAFVSCVLPKKNKGRKNIQTQSIEDRRQGIRLPEVRAPRPLYGYDPVCTRNETECAFDKKSNERVNTSSLEKDTQVPFEASGTSTVRKLSAINNQIDDVLIHKEEEKLNSGRLASDNLRNNTDSMETESMLTWNDPYRRSLYTELNQQVSEKNKPCISDDVRPRTAHILNQRDVFELDQSESQAFNEHVTNMEQLGLDEEHSSILPSTTSNELSCSLASELYQSSTVDVSEERIVNNLDDGALDDASIYSLEDEHLESGYNSDQACFTSILERAVSPCKSEVADSALDNCDFRVDVTDGLFEE